MMKRCVWLPQPSLATTALSLIPITAKPPGELTAKVGRQYPEAASAGRHGNAFDVLEPLRAEVRLCPSPREEPSYRRRKQGA